MTWDQDQVDSYIKILNWTNFEEKFCRLNTSNVIWHKSKQTLGHYQNTYTNIHKSWVRMGKNTNFHKSWVRLELLGIKLV